MPQKREIAFSRLEYALTQYVFAITAAEQAAQQARIRELQAQPVLQDLTRLEDVARLLADQLGFTLSIKDYPAALALISRRITLPTDGSLPTLANLSTELLGTMPEDYRATLFVETMATLAEIYSNLDSGYANIAQAKIFFAAAQAVRNDSLPLSVQNRLALLEATFDPAKAQAIYERLYALPPEVLRLGTKEYRYVSEKASLHWLAAQMLMYTMYKAKDYARAYAYAQEIISTYTQTPVAADTETMRGMYESALLMQAECAYKDPRLGSFVAMVPVLQTKIPVTSKNYPLVQEMRLRVARMPKEPSQVAANIVPLLKEWNDSDNDNSSIRLVRDLALLAYRDARATDPTIIVDPETLRLSVTEFPIPRSAEEAEILTSTYSALPTIFERNVFLGILTLLAKTTSGTTVSAEGDNDIYEQQAEAIIAAEGFDQVQKDQTLARLRLDYGWTLVKENLPTATQLLTAIAIARPYLTTDVTYSALALPGKETALEAYELLMLAYAKGTEPAQWRTAAAYYKSVLDSAATAQKELEAVRTFATLMLFKLKERAALEPYLGLLRDNPALDLQLMYGEYLYAKKDIPALAVVCANLRSRTDIAPGTENYFKVYELSVRQARMNKDMRIVAAQLRPLVETLNTQSMSVAENLLFDMSLLALNDALGEPSGLQYKFFTALNTPNGTYSEAQLEALYTAQTTEIKHCSLMRSLSWRSLIPVKNLLR